MSREIQFIEGLHGEATGPDIYGDDPPEDAGRLDAGLVLRGAFELFRGDPCAMFLVSEKMLEPLATNEELAQRFSRAFGRRITRQSIHKRLTKAAEKIPQLRGILCPKTSRG